MGIAVGAKNSWLTIGLVFLFFLALLQQQKYRPMHTAARTPAPPSDATMMTTLGGPLFGVEVWAVLVGMREVGDVDVVTVARVDCVGFMALVVVAAVETMVTILTVLPGN
jgi:hypothetical protein